MPLKAGGGRGQAIEIKSLYLDRLGFNRRATCGHLVILGGDCIGGDPWILEFREPHIRGRVWPPGSVFFSSLLL